MPTHLAALLKHKIDSSDGGQTQVPGPTATGKTKKALKRKAANEKRQARAAAERQTAQELLKKEVQKRCAKVKRQAAESTKEPATQHVPDASDATEIEQRPKKKVKRKRISAASQMQTDNETREENSFAASLMAGAEKDAELIRQAERELGITDPQQRKKMERAIFEDLGMDDLAEIGEEPSSGEEDHEGGENTKLGADNMKRKDLENMKFTDFLSSILGGDGVCEGSEFEAGAKKVKRKRKLPAGRKRP